MQFITTIILAVTSRLVALATAKPIPDWKSGGMAIPLIKHSSFPNSQSNKSIDLDAITSHGILVREKILSALDNYEMNTGTMHPFAVKRSDSESDLATRGASVALTAYQDMWLAEISIGTPSKTLKVHIDTGAADTWVLETGCEGISGVSDLWDPFLSESAEYQGKSFRFEYSGGSIVTGGQFTDAVTIAGFTADPQTFGSVTSYTSPLQNNGYAGGSLGLAFSSISELGADTLLESLVKQNGLINPTFSFKFSSSSYGAEMYVGGANSLLYNGNIVYTPITAPGLWQVSMDDVRIGGYTILENIPVFFDTGASLIFGDWEQVSELYRYVDGAQVMEREGFGFYYLPCDLFPTVSFTFSGRTFEIRPEALRLKPMEEGSLDCLSAIVAQRSRVAHWNIGLAFLQGVYSVFDYSALQVGFADLA